MRQILFRISFETPWMFWGFDPANNQSIVGAAVVASVIALCYAAHFAITRQTSKQPWLWLAVLYAVVAIVLTVVGLVANAGQPRNWPTLPLFGYGVAVLIAFLMGLWWAKRRARTVGIDPELITDTGFWLLVSAVAGGRFEYLRQYSNEVFPEGQKLGDALIRVINLREGGLVLVGALVGGTIGVIVFARIRKLNPWLLLDIVMPSAFLAIGFGRLGCLLNGCCFGDPCTLPWGISFAADTVPFKEIVERGFLSENAPWTMPLHPTQIYMAIDGFIMAGVTSLYFPLRRWNGELLAISAMCYSLSRFLIEFLRWDEMGQIATALTISQIYSVAIFTFALAAWLYGQQRYVSRSKAQLAPNAGV